MRDDDLADLARRVPRVGRMDCPCPRSGGTVDERWLADLDRIEHSAEQLRTPARFDGERYTLREHIGLVRRTVLAEAGAMAAVVAAEGKSVPA